MNYSTNHYLHHWIQVLGYLNDQAFWQYARFYGLVPQRFCHNRQLALKRLTSAPYVNEQFIRKELRHLGYSGLILANEVVLGDDKTLQGSNHQP